MNALCHVLHLHPLIWGRNSSAPVCTHCWKLPLEASALTTRLAALLILLIWGTGWGRKRQETLAKRAADGVCISLSVCRAWPGHWLQDDFMNLSHLWEHVLCSRGAHLLLQWPQKSPWDKAHPDTSLGWDILTTEMGKAQLSSFLEKNYSKGRNRHLICLERVF